MPYRRSPSNEDENMHGDSGVSRGQGCRLHLRLLQPEPHVHLAVHRRGGGEVLLGRLMVAGPPVELAEAEVAVGEKRAHPELVGQCGGLAVSRLGLIGMGWIATRGDLTKEVERPRLVSPFGPLAGERERPFGGVGRPAAR
jgi:hypothetical protein